MIGMFVERPRDGLGRDAVIHVQFFVDFGLHVDRLGTAHDQSAEHRLVRVARHGDLVARIARGHHHALIAAGRAVDQEKRVVGAPRLRRQLLRLFDRLGRLKQIVDPRHRREIDRADIVADEFAEGEVHPDALNVPRRVKRQDARIDVVEQRLKIRSLGLVERHPAYAKTSKPRRSSIAKSSASPRPSVVR